MNTHRLRQFLIIYSLGLVTIVCHSTSRANEVVGPLVGSVDSTSAQLLYRPSASEQPLQLSVLLDGKVVEQVTSTGGEDDDFVAKFSVANLHPNTRYHYRIDNADTQETLIAADETHSFHTANLARNAQSVSVGFVSCVDIEPNGIWKEMQSLDLDMVCLMGDTPYIDTTGLAKVRSRHRKFLQMPDLAELSANTPTVGTWDDHDFGRNNGNGRNLMDGKIDTRRGFVNYRAHSQFGTGTEGVYHHADLGMIEVFFLDPRYFSQTEPSPVDASQPTCFGSEQWEWLLAELRDSKAPFKVLALGAIWEDKKNKETDDMFTYWYERDAIFDVIKNENIDGVVLLGGDIHVARHLVHPQRVGYDLHDFVISPGHKRTITELDVYHPSLEWSLVEGWQFLTLKADGTHDVPTLTAEFRQPDGIVNRKVELPLTSLKANDQADRNLSLRAHWSFDTDLKNESVLGRRIDAVANNGAKIEAGTGDNGGALKLERSRQQYVQVPRCFLDDNSTHHTVMLSFKPTSLPTHGTSERHFLFESTAEGDISAKSAWHLSLGMRSSESPDQINMQLHTHTLQPASQPEAAPLAKSQGGFDTLIDRASLLDHWNKIFVTFDGEALTLTLNGKQLAKHQVPVPGPASEFGGLVIGGHREGTGRNFDGWINNVSVWQGELTPPAK
ncbi:alkaline phosphatase D family protein [Rhodopirellula bahusiensis]|uniref:Alkaline phosphatase n=1 Tax=Rhodopirellula bahusiensis TaxID=2014065 RepID=A0A2G1VYX3_9BACT|nr:alkaline phosphatase D family protein [Rhodopirellula bahusiensis]PHQ31972.1 alkaline phosphatase [Rhodopirellula bahusiensis]